MNIDASTLEQELEDGTLRARLESELTPGFQQIHESGERLPPASYFATQIAEIMNRDVALSADTRYNLYQEILLAVENARAAVLGEEPG